jgi:RHS repeat-associated protein
MELDNEVKGNGNSYTTEFRQFDPRVGRWLSLDPLMSMFPSLSPYCAFDNNPVLYIDPYGLASSTGENEPVDPISTSTSGTGEPVNNNPGSINGTNESPNPTDEVNIVAHKQESSSGWTRFWGGFKAAMGALEASIGAAMISTGVGAPLGVLFLVHGADVSAAGVNQMISGKEEKTLTYQGIKKVAKSAGASEQTAGNIAEVGDASISIASAGGGAAVSRAKPALTTVTAEQISNQVDNLSEIVVSNSKGETAVVYYKQLTGSPAYKSLNVEDTRHFFSAIVDNSMVYASKFTIKGGDNIYRSLYQIEGSLNGKSGVFEWIVEVGGSCTHRNFISGGKITGFPNQIVK